MKIEASNNALTIQLRYCFEDENLHSMNDSSKTYNLRHIKTT